MKIIIEEETVQSTDYSKQDLRQSEFVEALFKNCNFTEANLANGKIFDTTFDNCNLSMLKLGGTALKNVKFINCKISGTDFGIAADFMFAVNFDGCVLDYAHFYKKKMPKTVFKECTLREAVFNSVDLTQAVFIECDLAGATFQQNILDQADFCSAGNYQINPDANSLKKTRFSYPGVLGLLAKYNIIIE